MDAHQAALTVAADRSTVAPKHCDGQVESLRILLAERASAIKPRTAVMNQIHALLITVEDRGRADFRRYDGEKLVAVLAQTRPAAGHEPYQVARGSLKRLATRHRQISAEIARLDVQLKDIVRRLNPALLAAPGVGPLVAASLLVTIGDNSDRIGTKAQFAALCGVATDPCLVRAHPPAPVESRREPASEPCLAPDRAGSDASSRAAHRGLLRPTPGGEPIGPRHHSLPDTPRRQ